MDMERSSMAVLRREMFAHHARWLLEREQRSSFTAGLFAALSLALVFSVLAHDLGQGWTVLEGDWFRYSALAVFAISFLLAASMWHARIKAVLSSIELIALKIEAGEAAEELDR